MALFHGFRNNVGEYQGPPSKKLDNAAATAARQLISITYPFS